MKRSHKAANYAKALFKVQGSLEQIQLRQKNLEELAECIKEHPKMLYLLGCPEVSAHDKLEFLQKNLQQQLDPHVKRMLELMLKRQLASQIRWSAAVYHDLVVESLKGIDVEVSAAAPLTPATKKALLEKLEAKLQKKINLIETLDPKLLGGFTLHIHDQLLDLSLQGSLMKLKRTMLYPKSTFEADSGIKSN